MASLFIRRPFNRVCRLNKSTVSLSVPFLYLSLSPPSSASGRIDTHTHTHMDRRTYYTHTLLFHPKKINSSPLFFYSIYFHFPLAARSSCVIDRARRLIERRPRPLCIKKRIITKSYRHGCCRRSHKINKNKKRYRS